MLCLINYGISSTFGYGIILTTRMVFHFLCSILSVCLLMCLNLMVVLGPAAFFVLRGQKNVAGPETNMMASPHFKWFDYICVTVCNKQHGELWCHLYQNMVLPFLPAWCAWSMHLSGPKIVLHFLYLLFCLCIRIYHVHNTSCTLLLCDLTLVNLTAVPSTVVATMSTLAWLWVQTRGRGNVDARLTKSEKGRSKLLLVMPTCRSANRLRMAARRAPE